MPVNGERIGLDHAADARCCHPRRREGLLYAITRFGAVRQLRAG